MPCWHPWKRPGIKLKYKVRNSKKTKLSNQKTKEHVKCRYMYVYTRMIFAAVLSSTIKIFHRYLGPNLYICAVKVSAWFHRHFTEILWHFTAKKHWPSWFRAKSRCAYCICVLEELSRPWSYGSWSSNHDHDKVYSIQHYVIKFVSDLQQVSGFLQVLRFPPPIKLTTMK